MSRVVADGSARAGRAPRLALALVVCVAGARGLRAEDAPALPAPVRVRVAADPDTVTIGQRFRFTVEVQVQPGYETVLAQPSGRIGDFDLIDFGELPRETRGADTVITRWFTLAGFETGYKTLAAPPVQYRRPNEALVAAPEAHVIVTVKSVLPEGDLPAEIRDIRGPEDVPIDWRPYQIGGGVAAALLAIGAAVWQVLRRRRRAAIAPPPRPPHEIARQALAALKREGLIERGDFKGYYSALSGIVRTYLEGRFRLRAPEMTTEEFLQATARGGGLDRQHRELLGAFLVESDLVKFAKHVPTLADAERAITAAERFVDDTTPRDLPEERHAAG